MRVACCLLLLLHAAQAVAESADEESDEVEVLPGQLAPVVVLKRTAYLYAGITLALSPLMEPRLVSRLLTGLHIPEAVRRVVVAVCGALNALRSKHTLAVLLSHEVITDVTADVMAQAVAAREAGVRMAIDWKRVPRSTMSSLLSDDFPFLVWSRYLWIASERMVADLRASQLSPRLVRLLTNPVSVTVVKTAITQVVYETTSNGVYLSMQALLRGGGWRGVAAELRKKFFSVWRDGYATCTRVAWPTTRPRPPPPAPPPSFGKTPSPGPPGSSSGQWRTSWSSRCPSGGCSPSPTTSSRSSSTPTSPTSPTRPSRRARHA